MQRDYELALILNPEVSEEDTRAVLGRIEQVVANHDGQIARVNSWGRRRLAYPIEHNRDGIYIFIDMILTPETVIELERTLKVSELVLRRMTKRRDPKVVQKEREEREAQAVAGTVTQPTATAEEQVTPEEQAPTEEAVAEAPVVLAEQPNSVPPAVEETIET